MTMYELQPRYDSHKSFYGKARVIVDGNKEMLYSYSSLVATMENGHVEILSGDKFNSTTTRRHKREWLRQHDLDPEQYI